MMHQPRKFRLAASIVVCFLLQAYGADKYTDENRPYEFGFKIDGQQHRHESKDKDGIIMGEFGFITADDVYHVTVYATDKEGRFKILSMKNIHLKSTSASSPHLPSSARQGHSLPLPAQVGSAQISPAQVGPTQAPAAHQVPISPQPGKPFGSVALEPPGRSCSSCSLPTTTTRAPPPPPPAYIQPNSNNYYNSPNQFGATGSIPKNQGALPHSSLGQQNNVQGELGGQPYSSQGGQQNYPVGQNDYAAGEQDFPQQGPGVSQNYPQQASRILTGAQTFAQQPGQSAQYYPGAPSNVQAPSTPNAPNNYAQPEVSSSVDLNPGAVGQQVNLPQRYPGDQNNLADGNSGPYSRSGPSGPANSVPQDSNFGQGYPQQGLSGPSVQSPGQNSFPQGGSGGRASKQYNGLEQPYAGLNASSSGLESPGSARTGQPGYTKPTLVSAQMQIVDKNTDIHALRPGEKEGLPPGLSKDDMTQLLYTFNYTVGFHGHFEEGYTNGVKKGYYYVTGRNGVRTRIDYVADGSGFHPKVSQDVLELLSDDVPKPQTEKDAKYGLKGYEFKWLYYPVDSKRR